MIHQNRDFSLVATIRNSFIKFFTKKYLEYSIDNVLINNIFLITIHNHMHWKGSRYRYLEQIPHATVAIIYHVSLAFFCSIIVIFIPGCRGLCKQCCTNSIVQTIMSIISLYLSIFGSISPQFAMNSTLFYGEKIIEIFQRDNDEIDKICAFIKNFWEFHHIGIQNWIISAKQLSFQDRLDHQRKVRDMYEEIKSLSDIKKLFQYALQI